MLSSYGINPQFIFGCRADIRESLHFWDERKVLYVAGHNVVEYNMEENQQKFYSPMEGSILINALTMSPQRALMAFGETQIVKTPTEHQSPIIHIYDKTQRKRRSLVPTTIEATKVLSLSFATTKEERNILVLYGPPEYALIYWRWDSSTCEATLPLNTPVEYPKCSFSPADPSICVLTGQKVFMFMKIESRGEGKGDTLGFTVLHNAVKWKDKELGKHSNEFLTHCWTNDATLMIGTDQGELLVIDSLGFCVAMYKLPSRVECLVPFSQGIIAGCGGPTVYTLEFLKENSAEPLKIMQNYTVGKPVNTIISLGIRPNIEGTVICIMSSRQIIKLGLTTNKYEKLISGFHKKAIIGLDICVRKPLLVTCSEDKTIRFWNYAEKRQELKFKSAEIEPLSVAFHPSGLQVVVGCADKIHIMNVFLRTLKTSQEFSIKQFKEVSFSHGGHLLAISHTNTLHVYNFYTMEIIPHLTISPAKIQAIEWYEDDSGFVTSDQINYVSLCSLDSQPVNMVISNKLTVSSVLKIPESTSVYAAYSDRTIKEVNKDGVNKKLDVGSNPSQIAITRNQKLFFVGIGEQKLPGTVKYYKLPLTTGESTDIQAHSEEIKRMKISRDDRYLFTVGKDGCVIVYDIKERERTREKADNALPYSDEILTDKAELTDIQQKLEDARNRNKELSNPKSLSQDPEVGKLTRLIEDTMKKVKQKKVENSDSYQREQNDLSRLKSTQEEERKRITNENNAELEKMKREHLEAQSTKATEYSKRTIDRENLLKQHQDEKDNQIKQYADVIAELNKKLMDEREKLKAEVEQKRKEKETKEGNQGSIIEQIGVDNNKEIEMMRTDHSNQLQKLNEQVVKLRGDHQVNANKIEDGIRKINELTRDIKELEEAKKKAEEEEKKLKEENKNRNEILDQKSKEIAQREQEIYQHKKEAQELEKFKFVLDYKIKELKREINPRDVQIESLREKTTQMDKKLKKFNKLNVFLGYRLKELQEGQKTLQADITNMREKLRKNAISIKERLDALDHCVQFIHYPDKLKAAIIEKLDQYKKDGEQATKLPSTISNEFENHEKFMSAAVKDLENKLEASKKVRKGNNKLVRHQNKILIDEIEKLRKQLFGANASIRGQKAGKQFHSTLSKSKIKEEDEDITDKVAENKETIKVLRVKIEELKKENEDLKAAKNIQI